MSGVGIHLGHHNSLTIAQQKGHQGPRRELLLEVLGNEQRDKCADLDFAEHLRHVAVADVADVLATARGGFSDRCFPDASVLMTSTDLVTSSSYPLPAPQYTVYFGAPHSRGHRGGVRSDIPDAQLLRVEGVRGESRNQSGDGRGAV